MTKVGIQIHKVTIKDSKVNGKQLNRAGKRKVGEKKEKERKGGKEKK